MKTFFAIAPPFDFSFLINRNSEWPLSNLLPSGPGAGGAEKAIMKTKEELSMKMHKENVQNNLREEGKGDEKILMGTAAQMCISGYI